MINAFEVSLKNRFDAKLLLGIKMFLFRQCLRQNTGKQSFEWIHSLSASRVLWMRFAIRAIDTNWKRRQNRRMLTESRTECRTQCRTQCRTATTELRYTTALHYLCIDRSARSPMDSPLDWRSNQSVNETYLKTTNYWNHRLNSIEIDFDLI